MYTTTPQYDSKVYVQDEKRQFKSRVEFEIIDVDAYSDATVTVTGEAAISKKDQTVNLTRNLSGKYGTFENDYWDLAGNFVLPPKVAESGFEVGWWSDDLSQADKTFSVSQVHTSDFTIDHDSIGITVTFDPESNQYAEDFTIQVYDSVAALIDSDTVTGNTLSKYVWEATLADIRQVVVTITKWKEAYRRARIVEVDYGVIKEYTNEEIIQCDVLKEINIVSEQIPSDEMKLVLDNQDQEFNILNPAGIFSFLQRKQKIKPYYGLVTVTGTEPEWVPMGVFYLNTWNSDQGSLTASFTARDLLDLMKESLYRKGKIQSRTLYNLAVDVLTDYGLTSSDYSIDSALSSITSTGNIPILTHTEALQLIAVAGECVLYTDRDGVVTLEQISAGASADTIDFDNVYFPPRIKLDKLVNTVEVGISEFTLKGASENIFTGTVNVNGTEDVWIEYKEFPAASVSSVITGAISVNSETYYGNAGLINITAAGNVTITTTGTVYEKAEGIYREIDGSAPADENTISLKLSNDLITSTSIASGVADWILTEKNKRFVNIINWRQNPAQDIGDVVTVEDKFGENNDSTIIKQEFKYSGALKGFTTTKGG